MNNSNYGMSMEHSDRKLNDNMGMVGGTLYGTQNTQMQVRQGGMQNGGNYQMSNFPSTDVRTGTPQAISIYSEESMMPETMTNTAYIPAYLRHQIGRWMRIEFLIGNILEEKVGQLLDVGASYIILKMLEPSTTMLCDLYSIKFITIIYDVNLERLYTR